MAAPKQLDLNRPTPHAWRAAYEQGLSASRFTGEVVMVCRYDQGVLINVRLTPPQAGGDHEAN